ADLRSPPSCPTRRSSDLASKGESLLDTIDNLVAMHADMFVVRHAQSGAPFLIAEHVNRTRGSEVHVINAGDGRHAHPTQGLLDIDRKSTRLNSSHVKISY